MEHSSMNPRIQKLIDQATRTAMWIGDPDAGELDAEKFAELIVRECGEVAYKAYWDNPETVRGIHIKEQIKKHFGVE
jgi:hypothetical protein